jgi:tetratricopeptide (TPR) repeat protein/DNA-binding XRE family transcriptional regulator
VAAEPALSFADLLRRLRTEARLTQEELAEAAGISPRSVSDLERGINRTARKDTALLLADALSLTGQVRVLFVAPPPGWSTTTHTSRRRPAGTSPPGPRPVTAPPPGDPPGSVPKVASADEAAAWLDAQRPNLHAAVGFAAEAMPRYAVAIATAMGGFLRARGHWDRAAGQYQTALSAAHRAGDRPGQAGTLDELGQVQQLTGDYPAAVASHRQALAMFRRLGSRFDEADALSQLGFAARAVGDYPAAASYLQQGLEQFRDLGDRLGQAWALHGLGHLQRATGDYRAASASFGQVLRLYQDLGSRHGRAKALNSLGGLSLATSAAEEARHYHGQALAIAREIGAHGEEADALAGIGLSLLPGRPAEAAAPLRDALAIYQRIGSPVAQGIEDTLARYGLDAQHLTSPAGPPAAGGRLQ